MPLTPDKTVKLEGYFDMQKTYSAIKNHLAKTLYYDDTEKDFTEKNKGGYHYVYTIQGWEFFYSDYLKICFSVKLEMQGNDVEIEIDGKKQVLIDGKIKLSIFGYGESDWMEKRKKHPFVNFMGKVLDKWYGKDTLGAFKAKANRDFESTIEVLKQQVNARVNYH